MRQRRYRTPFSGSSYLYAADADFRGRAATLCIGPVAVGDIVKVNVRWTDKLRQANQFVANTQVARVVNPEDPESVILRGMVASVQPMTFVEETEYAPVPMTYSMISKMLCEQGAPRSIGISGWATGFVPTVTLNTDDYLRQWVLEFAHRMYPSLVNTLGRYGIAGTIRRADGARDLLTDEARNILDRLRDRDMTNRAHLRETVREIWNLVRIPVISAPTPAGVANAFVHIPYTYLARGKPPRALRASFVWVFAKTQLEHEISERAALKGYRKYGLKDGEFAGKDETNNTFIARAYEEERNLFPADTIGDV